MRLMNVADTQISFLFLLKLLSVALVLATTPAVAMADDRLAGVIGDGNPWEMYVVRRKVSNILVFRPDGFGTISDSLASITVTWRAVSNGICITPEGQAPERCHELTKTKDGIAASQNGHVVFVLKR